MLRCWPNEAISLGAGRVLQLRAQGQIVAHAVLADAHQRPLIADQGNAFFGSEGSVDSAAELTQRAAVIVKAVIAESVGIGEDKIRAALDGERLLAFGQQEALLLLRPSSR